MRFKTYAIGFTLLIWLLVACQPSPPEPTPTATFVSTTEPDISPTHTQIPTKTPENIADEVLPDPTPEAGEILFEWPEPIEPEEPFTRNQVTAAEQATFDLLISKNYAANDPVQLAVEIQGVPKPPPPPGEPPDLHQGDIQKFWIPNTDTRAYSQIEARLARITEHAYFWYDTNSEPVGQAAISFAAEGFENLYPLVRQIYGGEPSPGIDGDPRVHLVHADASALCSGEEIFCRLLGYFSPNDTLPTAIEEHSNQREMFVLNINGRGQDYISTLTHEFRHMVENNYDRHDDGWEVEGTAVMAEALVGDSFSDKRIADTYLNETDVQLNSWTSGSPLDYAKGYVFSRYIYDRFGPEFYSAWVQHPDRAFFAINAVLDEFGYPFNAHDLWLDYGVAVALLGEEHIPEPYAFSPDFGSDTSSKSVITGTSNEINDQVRQYGFDIYELRGEAPRQVNFNGATKVAVIENLVPASGAHMWWSGRANQSDMNLTREIDLTGVESATLNYAVSYSIERGYDYGYVLVSTDNGESWQTLVSDNMQGEQIHDNPNESALTDRFYTGLKRAWIQESIDLSDYAGQTILIRFQYITDAAVTLQGLSVDNISVPEIGFYDDVESLDAGWIANGFTRINAYEPQRFHLVLITFNQNGEPIVERIPISQDNIAKFQVELSEDSSRAFLIVTATNPLILTPASYQISVSQ
jgi:hypothetical protein